MDDLREEDYFPIPLTTLRVDTIQSFNIFIKIKQSKMVLYHTGSYLFTTKVRNNLINNNVNFVYVHKKDEDVYNRYIEENLSVLLNDPNVSTQQKAEFAHISVTIIAQTLFERPSAKTIIRYKTAISSLTDFVLKDEKALNHLISLTSLDFDTYIHSVNVGIFSIGLAKVLLANDPRHNMSNVASGFFLHDIGKCNIPISIIKKQGPLSNVEWEIMKRHPHEGYEILKKFDALTEEARVIVVEHHEHNDGTGYPDGLQGKKIHIYSKICRISDAFEALTAKRPYKKSLSAFESLKLMKKEMRGEFDPTFFEQFVLLFAGKKRYMQSQ